MAKRPRNKIEPKIEPHSRSGREPRTATAVAKIAPPPRIAWYSRDWFRGLILALAIFIVYLPVWHAGFVWDDDDHITANPTVIGPLGLKEIWTTGAGDIAPLTRSTFWLEYKFFGLQPLPYHLINLLLQAACAILLWRILRRLRVPGAWLGAAIWTLHPLQVQSIAWISEMKNTESGLFFLLSIFFFIDEIKQRDTAQPGSAPTGLNWRYALTLLFAALAMVAKASTMVLPASLCLCAWWLEGRWRWRNLLKMIPVVIMSVLASAMAIWATARRQAVSHDHPLVRTLPQRIVGAGDALWFYLGKLVWPHPLMALYPDWKIDARQWFSWLPVVAIVMALLFLWPRRGSRGLEAGTGQTPSTRPYFFALAWFIAALLPALGLVDPYTHRYSAGYSLVYDHFQYLAGMAPMALAGAGIVWLTNFLITRKTWARPILAVIVLLLLALTSWQRVWAFQSNQTLWTDAVAKNPDCWSCHYNLGTDLLLQGQSDAAMAEFQKTVDISPGFAKAQNNLGIALSQKGRDDEAIAHFQTALASNPPDQDAADAHYNLGSALLRKGRVDEAIAHFRKALEINPAFADSWNNLGIAFDRKSQPDEAMEQYRKALELNPGYAEAHYNLGHDLLQSGRADEGIAHLQESSKIDPSLAQPHNDLGIAFAQRRQFNEAAVQFEEALQVDPGYQSAQENLAKVQAMLRPARGPGK